MDFLNKRTRDFAVRAEVIETAVLTAVLVLFTFAFPLIARELKIPNEQFIMGPAVNCALIIVGINCRGLLKISAAVFLPSLAHIANFYLFAVGTPSSLYMLPAIWVGNVIIVLAFKYFYTNKKLNFALTSAIAVIAKAAAIFGIYLIMSAANIVPRNSALTASMGLNQLLVGVIGAAISFIFVAAIYKNSLSSKPKLK
jgi:hypothetical protein